MTSEKKQDNSERQEIHSPLLRFRKRANCQNCELRDACKVDKLLELRCILALIADSQHNNTRLNIIRGAQL